MSSGEELFPTTGGDSVGVRRSLSEGDALGYPPGGIDPLERGLVAWYPLFERRGATAHDLAGDNNGTVNGATPAGGQGVMGMPAYSFDGVDDYVNTEYESNGLLQSEFAVSCWIHPNGWGEGGYGRILSNRAGNDNGIEVNVRQDHSGVRVMNLNGGQSADSAAVSLSEWHHVVAQRRDGNLELYTDTSVESAQLSNPILESANPFYIGNRASDTARAFNGRISAVRLYNRALSAEEVAALYERGAHSIEQATARPGVVREGGVARYSMDSEDVSADGTTLTDSWGVNDGTINGATPGAAGVGGTEAFSFDSVDDIVNIGTTDYHIAGKDDFTLTVWLKWDGTDTQACGVYQSDPARDSSPGNPPYGLVIQDTDQHLRGHIQQASNDSVGVVGPPPPVGEWLFCAFLRDSANNELRLYYDAAQTAVTGWGGNIYDEPEDAAIGAWKPHKGRFFAGELDEVRLYDRALSDRELWRLYTSSPHYSEVTAHR